MTDLFFKTPLIEIDLRHKFNSETNKEFYLDKILSAEKPQCLMCELRTGKKQKNCKDACKECIKKNKEWLEKEREAIDYSKLKEDDPVYVSNEGIFWKKANYATFPEVKDKMLVFSNGKNSWTADKNVNGQMLVFEPAYILPKEIFDEEVNKRRDSKANRN